MFVDNKTIKRVFMELSFDENCSTDPFEVSDVATIKPHSLLIERLCGFLWLTC